MNVSIQKAKDDEIIKKEIEKRREARNKKEIEEAQKTATDESKINSSSDEEHDIKKMKWNGKGKYFRKKFLSTDCSVKN